MDKIINYFRESYFEAKKVNWPTKKQVTDYSILVIGLSIGFALLFMILDNIFNFGIEKLITK